LKLVTYTRKESAHLGAIIGDRALDLPQAYEAYREQPGAPAPAEFPGDMLSLLQGGDEALRLAASVIDWAQAQPGIGDMWQLLAQVRLAAPLANPGKIVCVGLNYHDHCRETGTEVPERPVLFAKFPSTIIGPGDTITWPADVSQQVDYEAELGVIIGKQGRHIPEDEALDYVAAYTNANDVSARDAQFADGQWVRGKSFDTFCPIGPYLLTADEVPDPQDLRIQCRLNGDVMQDSTTAEMIFGVRFLLAYISRTCTLMPGDIIITGTPGGVGVSRNPQVFIKPGDIVEIEVDKLGCLRNPVG